MVLPLVGGAPAVWTTCLMFFQAALLGGYLYAHLATLWLGVRAQSLLHAAIMLAPLAVLPLSIDAAWGAPDPARPIRWLLLSLLGSVGLPFIVVAANAPLLQRWFAATRHLSARDPYFLYAASNLGSLLGLLAYPFVIEPRLTLAEQSTLWTAGYGVLVALTWGTIALAHARSAHPGALGLGGSGETTLAQGDAAERATIGRRLRWLGLSFVPSTLMLSVTTHISTDIAAVPLLWVVPLGLYLVTFILTFARRPPLPHRWMVAALPIVVIPPMLSLIMKSNASPGVLVPLHLLALFVAGMVCHGEVVRLRPAAERLTGFYLWIAAGGVAGGVFSTVVAPMLFTTPLEYPLAVVLACLCRPASAAHAGRRSPLDYAPVGVATIIAVQMAVAHYARLAPIAPQTLLLIFLPAMLTCAIAMPRPRAYAAGLAVVLAAGTIWHRANSRIEHIERNFFGVQSIEMSSHGQYRAFVHGTTIHGTQALNPDRRSEPTTYFTRSGPAGQVLTQLTAAGARNVAVVGLGAGTLASYASPGQSWTFYEINPAVERLAKNTAYFTYLDDCGAVCRVVLGDARLTLALAPAAGYNAIVLDAFSSDAIPIHLLTKEALVVYLRALAPGGVLLIHVSNRFLDLRPVVAGLANDAGLAALGRNDYATGEAEAAAGKLGSAWVVVARASADLGDVATDPRWVPLESDPAVGVWTDNFSNVFTVLRMGSGGPFGNRGK